jgi:hypothetical protein
MPRRLRLLGRFLGFAFGPIRGLPTALQWVPTVIAVAAGVLGIIGLSIPSKIHLSRPSAIALASIALVLLFFIAALRLWVRVHPDFPSHIIRLGRPWIITDPDSNEKLVLLDVKFTNRETNRRVHLNLDVFWLLRQGERKSLGPYKLFPRTRPLGTLPLMTYPTDVGPEAFVERIAVFDVSVPGVDAGEEASDFTAPERFDFFVRLSDDLSGAELDVPLEVARPDKTETALAELTPRDERLEQISRLVGAELNEVRRIIEKARKQPGSLRVPSLPAFRWDEYDEELARSQDLYSVVKRAYTAIHRVNDEGAAHHRVSEAYDLAGEALDALGEARDAPYQTEAAKAATRLLEGVEPQPEPAEE